MASTNYTVNYEDERFAQVEADKQAALSEVKGTYDNLIGQTDQYYQDQINAAKDYATTQQQIQQDNTDFTIEQIEQQKQQANKDYTKEQSGAYVDWQKQSDQFGAQAEQMAAGGLTHSGYSESSQVSMYNTYQNRVAVARESYNNAVLAFENSIKDARLQNNSKLAEIAYQALQTQLELSLEGFQYKNQLVLEQAAKQQETEQMYYSRYQDVVNQINTENAMEEEIRQYNESLALEKEQFTEQKRQYEQNYALEVKQYEESIRQFDEEIARLKAKDKAEADAEAKRLELQKQQLEQQKKEAERNYQLALKELSARLKEIDAQIAYTRAKTSEAYASAKAATASVQATINKTKSSSSSSSGRDTSKPRYQTTGSSGKSTSGIYTQFTDFLSGLASNAASNQKDKKRK